MRNFSLLLLLLVSLATTAAGQSAHGTLPQQPFAIGILAEGGAAAAGSTIRLRISLTNNSNHEISASASYEGGFNQSYLYDVRAQDGTPVPPRRHEGPITDTSKIRTLKPGETLEEVTEISGEFDLSKPGKYTIQVSRPISSDPHAVVVKSNKITVTVTP